MKNIKRAVIRARIRDEWYSIKRRAAHYNKLKADIIMCDTCGCDPCDCHWGENKWGENK